MNGVRIPGVAARPPCKVRRHGGVAEWFRQGPAKPCTAVRFRSPPPASIRGKVPGQRRFSELSTGHRQCPVCPPETPWFRSPAPRRCCGVNTAQVAVEASGGLPAVPCGHDSRSRDGRARLSPCQTRHADTAREHDARTERPPANLLSAGCAGAGAVELRGGWPTRGCAERLGSDPRRSRR